jgi:hypothetical protein
MKFTLDDNDDQHNSNVVLIPIAVPKGVFALLTRAGAREGKSASQLLAEKFRSIIEDVEMSLQRGDGK